MPFTKRGPVTDVGRISCIFETENALTPVTGSVSFVLIDTDGNPARSDAVDLIPHMTPAQINAITNFLAQVRTKIAAEAV